MPGLAEELAPALRGAQLLGQLVATCLAKHLVLGLVGRLDPLDDLFGDLPELVVACPAGVTRQPRAIDRHHPRLHQPALITQPQHLTKQVSQRALVTHNEAGDRGMVRHRVAGNHPIGHVLATVTFDRPRGAHVGRERVQHQRHHHRRLVRRPTVTVRPIGGIERPKVHVLHGVDHKPRQVIRRKPIPHVQRQQKPLLTTILDEVLRHAGILLNAPDGTLSATAFRAGPPATSQE